MLLLAMVASAALSEDEATDHGFFGVNEVKWGAGPPSLASARQVRRATRAIRPRKACSRCGYGCQTDFRSEPHTHPAFEHITVISGTFNLGMGEKFDTTKGKALEAGAFAYLAPKTNHFAWSKGETVVQLHGEGPWQINYLNPADDPRKK